MAARSEPPPVTDGEVGEGKIGRLLERPGPATAAAAVEAALERGLVVLVAGECAVESPSGQRLQSARRLAILKPDGSLVVHGREGTRPVVGLSGELEVAAVDGALEVAVTAEEGSSRLHVERVELLASAALDPGSGDPVTDDVAKRPTTTAGDRHGALRERVLDDPALVESGFTPLATERETPAGPVDVFGRDAEGQAVVVEIKADRAGPAAVGQIDRYVEALRRDLHADAEVRGVLVAPSATERTRRLLEERGYVFCALSPE